MKSGKSVRVRAPALHSKWQTVVQLIVMGLFLWVAAHYFYWEIYSLFEKLSERSLIK